MSLSSIIGQASRGADLYFVFRFLRLLTMKYESTDAYKFGIIDKKGKALKKSSELESVKEKSSYTMLHRMVFKIRRLMEKIPGGRFVNYAAALFLLKEQNNTRVWTDDVYMKTQLLEFLETDWESDAKFLKEEVDNMDKKSFKSFLSEKTNLEESQKLQAMMALDDAGIEAVVNKKGQIVINKKDLKKAEAAFKKSFRKGGAPELQTEEMDPRDHVQEKDGKFNVISPSGKMVYSSEDKKEAEAWAVKNHDTLMKEGIDIEKSDIKDVIKDFQSSDAPQFKGKSDKKKKEMAIAAKLSKEEFEIDESTKEYAKSLEKIANDRTLKSLSKSERENLKKIADLLAKEEVELGEASKLPPHLAKFFDKKGDLKPEVAARIAKGQEKLNIKDVTPKGYGPKEEVELGEAKVSDDMINILKKKYESLRGKKLSLSQNQEISLRVKGFPKEGLLQLVKADIPFISLNAATVLMAKYGMKAKDINMSEAIEKEGAAEFMAAASAAKKEGKKKFKFGGKEYPVTIKVDIPLANEEIELGEGFKVGDKVKVKNSGTKGHKGYEGRSGKVVKDYGDGDMKVNFGGNDDRSISSKDLVKEEIANSVGGGGIAGLDIGLTAKKKKEDTDKAKALRKQMVGEEVQRTTFAGKDVFIVDSETFHTCRLGKKKYGRYETYVGDGEVGQTIREYGLKYPRRPIILQNGDSGPMLYLKYGRS